MKKAIISGLCLVALLNSCVEQESSESASTEDQLKNELENIQIEEVYDTVTVATLHMKVVGKENLIQCKYKPGMSAEDIMNSDFYENLVKVDVLGNYEEDDDAAYDSDEMGSVKTKIEVFDMLKMNMENIDQTFRVSVFTDVDDFSSWKKAFDEEDLNRKNAGMRVLQIGLNRENPKEVFMLIGIDDIARAREMMNHDGLKKKMKDAGVIGEPRIKFWRPAGPQSEEL